VYTLDRQRAEVAALWERAGTGRRVLAINAEDVYVLANERAPWRYLRVHRVHEALIAREPGGCHGLVERMSDPAWAIIVFARQNQRPCARAIGQHLDQRYHRISIDDVARGRPTLAPDRAARRPLEWRIYDTSRPRA
jgi:hypothetical protein